MDREGYFSAGKLPAPLLARLLAKAPIQDPAVLLGPGIGLDCAVVAVGDTLLVYKSDPITFVTDQIGDYLVQVNVNDIATTGAVPRWLMITLLLPEGRTTIESVEAIVDQIYSACRNLNVAVIGGHTEITHDLKRPIAIGTMIGEVSREHLITPRGATPYDRILLTKGVPIEATAILAREFPEVLGEILSQAELKQAQNFLHDPGICIFRDAQIAVQAGKVTAMHDPTEGGLATALWELAEASGHLLYIDPKAVVVPPIAARICQFLEVDPLAAIASGALLLTVPPGEVAAICSALEEEGIPCAEIGEVQAGSGSPAVWCRTFAGEELLSRPERDEIARLQSSSRYF